MKIVFEKGEDLRVSVAQEIEGMQKEFSYVDMMSSLIKNDLIEDVDLPEEFSEAEIASIKTMISRINTAASSSFKKSSDEEE